ncbi:MAG: DNA repair protein RecO [Clostridia bacterium]|nr:DNA repair protein RecO [Clostridia bacterium]
MGQTVKAVVLACEGRKESDRLVWLLCDFGQILRAYVRGARNGKNKLSAATEPFVLGSFDVFRTTGGYVIDDAEIEEQFFALRADLKNYTLAGYFAQLIRLLFSEDGDAQLYPLFANCLHLLSHQKREPALIKAVFEFRVASLAGYRPLTDGCADCGLTEVSAFSVESGAAYCEQHAAAHRNIAAVGTACMRAISAACGGELRKAFGFTLSGESLINFCTVAQAHLLYRIEEMPPALQYYLSLTEFEKQLGIEE